MSEKQRAVYAELHELRVKLYWATIRKDKYKAFRKHYDKRIAKINALLAKADAKLDAVIAAENAAIAAE